RRFIVKYGRLPEGFLGVIIAIDGIRSNDQLFDFISAKMTKLLGVAIGIASFIASFVDIFDYAHFLIAGGTHIVLSGCLCFF
ncbi:unnamed protein product, partial [Rotaria sordida]